MKIDYKSAANDETIETSAGEYKYKQLEEGYFQWEVMKAEQIERGGWTVYNFGCKVIDGPLAGAWHFESFFVLAPEELLYHEDVDVKTKAVNNSRRGQKMFGLFWQNKLASTEFDDGDLSPHVGLRFGCKIEDTGKTFRDKKQFRFVGYEVRNRPSASTTQKKSSAAASSKVPSRRDDSDDDLPF